MIPYPHDVSFYPAEAGGTYGADRTFTRGAAPEALWSGKADVQDRGRALRKGRTGDVTFDFDAVIYPRERDEATLLALLEEQMKVSTPFGDGHIVKIVRLDGTIFVKYGR